MTHICKLNLATGQQIIGLGRSRIEAVANASQSIASSALVAGITTRPVKS